MKLSGANGKGLSKTGIREAAATPAITASTLAGRSARSRCEEGSVTLRKFARGPLTAQWGQISVCPVC